jgi:hypothetical protein
MLPAICSKSIEIYLNILIYFKINHLNNFNNKINLMINNQKIV